MEQNKRRKLINQRNPFSDITNGMLSTINVCLSTSKLQIYLNYMQR